MSHAFKYLEYVAFEQESIIKKNEEIIRIIIQCQLNNVNIIMFHLIQHIDYKKIIVHHIDI